MENILNEKITIELAIILVIAVVVAFLIELLKHTNLKITEKMTHLLSLIFGIVGGMIGLHFTNGDFATYVIIGLTGAIAAPGIYDLLIKKLGFSKGVDK